MSMGQRLFPLSFDRAVVIFQTETVLKSQEGWGVTPASPPALFGSTVVVSGHPMAVMSVVISVQKLGSEFMWKSLYHPTGTYLSPGSMGRMLWGHQECLLMAIYLSQVLRLALALQMAEPCEQAKKPQKVAV